jgi:hypothetical protein
VRDLLFGIEPGMREDEAVGLLSPSSRLIQRGDRFTAAFGVWGGLNCRAGFVVEDESELTDEVSDYFNRLVGRSEPDP